MNSNPPHHSFPRRLKNWGWVGAGVLAVVIAILNVRHRATDVPTVVGLDKRATNQVARDRGDGEASSIPANLDTRKDFLQPPPNPLQAQIESFLSQWAGMQELEKREELMERWVRGIALADYPYALSLLTEPAFEARGRELRIRLFRIWGETEPRMASAWVGRMSTGPMKSEAASSVAGGFASRDFEAALSYFRALPQGSEREPALLELAATLAKTDPKRALALGVELGSSPDRDRFLQSAANAWASIDGQAASQWASQIPDSELRQAVLGEVLVHWSEVDPASAATSAMTSLEPGRRLNDTLISIVQRWAQNDPEPVADWILAFPAGELRDTASEELVKQWSQKDIGKAGQWIDGIEDLQVKDIAIATMAGQLGLQAPQAAGDWLLRISDPNKLAVELRKFTSEWIATDGPSAKAWISQSTLSEALKVQLMAPP